MKNIFHSLLLPAALLLSGASAYIPERGPSQVAVVLAGSSSYIPARSTSPAAGTAPVSSLGVRGDASVAFRAPRSIPPTGLRPWVPPAHEAAGGHGPLGITPGLQDTLRRGSGELCRRDGYSRPVPRHTFLITKEEVSISTKVGRLIIKS